MNLSKIPTALSLMAGLALVSAPLAAERYSGFVPSALMVEDTRRTLPLDPKHVLAMEDAAYVVGIGESGPEILRLDGSSLEVTAARPLGMEPGDAILSFDAQLLYVIGTQDDGHARVLVLDPALELVGELTLKMPLAHPALSLAEGNRLLVGGLPTSEVEGALVAIDVSDPKAPEPIPALMPDTFNMLGIAGVWLEEVHAATLFISTGLVPTLVAVEVGPKGVAKLSDLTFDYGGYEQKPLTIFGNMSSRQCLDDTELTSFLISSNINQNLLLVVFDPDFRSLDVVSRTETSLRLNTGPDAERYANSKILLPTSLLSSSCNMGVVWISDLNAREIEQFAVNPDLMILEKVGEFALQENPSGLAISASGRTAYVISSQARTITRYQSGGDEISGTESARTLQRLLTERGFPVGTIDGQIGERTMTAVSRFEERNKVDLDIRGDLEGALTILQNAPLQ